jgi:cold shock CspA family protein
MTGRIKNLNTGNASGFIKAENGSSVRFHSSAVLAYDINSLALGQLVTFDLDGGNYPKAVNVCVHNEHQVGHAPKKRPETIPLRYMGFEQKESIRAYRFQRITPGEETKAFIVTIDLALFTKHHVSIQEGPALCLHLLMVELDAAIAAQQPPFERSLTDQDMLAHLASRPVPKTKSGPKRTPRTAAAASHAP